jgi:uridine kinase
MNRQLDIMPFVVGIAGGSGSGKSTVARRLAERVGPHRVQILQHDAYYRDLGDMPVPDPSLINYDHPESLETSLCVEHLRQLKRGVSVRQPLYDFSTHHRSAETRLVEPTPILILDGILVLASDELRRECDLAVYVDAGADLRFLRRLERDINERGRTIASVKEQYLRTVRPMHDAHVEPCKHHADIIIPWERENDRAITLLAEFLLRRLDLDPAR